MGEYKKTIRFQKCDTLGQIPLALLMTADLHELDEHNFNQKGENPLIVSAVTEPKEREREKKAEDFK